MLVLNLNFIFSFGNFVCVNEKAPALLELKFCTLQSVSLVYRIDFWIMICFLHIIVLVFGKSEYIAEDK